MSWSLPPCPRPQTRILTFKTTILMIRLLSAPQRAVQLSHILVCCSPGHLFKSLEPLEQDPTLALSAPDSLPLHVPPGLTARLPRPPGREDEREAPQAAAHQETGVQSEGPDLPDPQEVEDHQRGGQLAVHHPWQPGVCLRGGGPGGRDPDGPVGQPHQQLPPASDHEEVSAEGLGSSESSVKVSHEETGEKTAETDNGKLTGLCQYELLSFVTYFICIVGISSSSDPATSTLSESGDNTLSLQSCSSEDGPRQPLLDCYNPRENRDFRQIWYQKFPFIEFDVIKKQVSCYCCSKFNSDNTWTFTDWKQSHLLKRHSESKEHKFAMVKWMEFKLRMNGGVKSVAEQLSSFHHSEIKAWREYAKQLFQNIAFLAKQNLAFRGSRNSEVRENMSSESPVNRGNFIELLCLRAQDNPLLKSKIDAPAGAGGGFGKWTSGKVQNEMLNILAGQVTYRLLEEVKKEILDEGYYFSIIVDETRDTSNTEQFSLSLSFVDKSGVKKESFIMFIDVERTDAGYLFEKLLEAITRLELDPRRCISIAADGASNMSGHTTGLAARWKEVAPLSVYTHCWAHRLNLVVKDLLSNIPALRKTMGLVQNLYVFIEGSPKRHHLFISTTIPESDKQAKTLKNLSGTRWALQAESVSAVHSELKRVIKCLDSMQDDPEPKISSQASSLLHSIVDEEFIFNINLLKVVLTPTTRLSDYLQGRNVDIRKAHENVRLVVETLENLRNDSSFEEVRNKSKCQVTEVTEFIESEELACSVKEIQVPRASKQWKGDSEGFLRVNNYFQTIDKITSELHRRFDPETKTILNSLATICFEEDVENEVFVKVGSYYSLKTEQLITEHKMFPVFKVNNHNNPIEL